MVKGLDGKPLSAKSNGRRTELEENVVYVRSQTTEEPPNPPVRNSIKLFLKHVEATDHIGGR